MKTHASAIVWALVAGLPATALSQAAGWRLAETLRIGRVGDEVEFALITGVAAHANGEVFVADAREKTVYQFSASGKLIRRIGRSGAGPGEFGAPSSIGFYSDSLWVSDRSLLRLSLFDRSGKFSRSWRMPGFAGAVPTMIALARDGMLIRTEPGFDAVPGNAYLTRANWKQAASPPPEPERRIGVPRQQEAGRDTLVTLKKGVGWWPLGNGFMKAPISDESRFAVNAKGDLVIVHQEIASERTNSYEIQSLDSNAKVLWSRRYTYKPVALSDAMREASIRRRIGGASAQGPQLNTAGVSKVARFPAHAPPVSGVVAGEDNTIWLRREDVLPGPHVRWEVLDASGNLIATLQLPRETQLRSVSRSVVWAIVRDADDVQMLVRYVVRPG